MDESSTPVALSGKLGEIARKEQGKCLGLGMNVKRRKNDELEARLMKAREAWEILETQRFAEQEAPTGMRMQFRGATVIQIIAYG